MSAHLAGVGVHFGAVEALRGIDVDLGPGVTAVLGPNGAGKTTLLRLLATVTRPSVGTVTLLGLDPASADDRARIRRRLGYVPQDADLHRRFTPFEFVDYIAILKEMGDEPVRHRAVRHALDLVGLGPVAHRRGRTLSGGMRRRAVLAQALLGRPELVVLDEPLTGLDPQQRLEVRGVLGDLGAGASVVLTTHHADDVVTVCGRVMVLAAGAIVFDGTPAALAARAAGHAWCAPAHDCSAVPPADVLASWRLPDGQVRYLTRTLGPPTATAVAPSVEDGYLVLIAGRAR